MSYVFPFPLCLPLNSIPKKIHFSYKAGKVNSAISRRVLGTDNREVQEQGGKLLSVRFSETIVLACFLLVNVIFVSFPCSSVQIQLRVFFTWLWLKSCAHIPYWPKFKHDIVNLNFSFTSKDLFHWILDPYLKVLVNHIFLPKNNFFILYLFCIYNKMLSELDRSNVSISAYIVVGCKNIAALSTGGRSPFRSVYVPWANALSSCMEHWPKFQSIGDFS